jgi:hypothetical protein
MPAMNQRYVGFVKDSLLAACQRAVGDTPGMDEDEHQTASEARANFARALGEVRRRYGAESGQGELSQEAFARLLGISGDRPGERYGHYERGSREPPIWVLAAIRRVTGYSMDDLIANLPAGRRIERLPPSAAPPRRRRPFPKSALEAAATDCNKIVPLSDRKQRRK